MRLRKEIGQHLLTDRGALRRMAEAARVVPGGLCVEIGPGTGNLTRELLALGARVVAVELDERMAARLERSFSGEPRLSVVRADILKVSLDDLVPEADRPAVATGNLPYYISSPIIFKLLDRSELFSRVAALVQKEVGVRMCAPPGSRDYGMLSVFCQAVAECEELFTVPPGAFNPPPAVDSCAVSLAPLPPGSSGVEDRRIFSLIVRGLFEHRRKTCYNSLRISLLKGVCRELSDSGADAAGLQDSVFSDLKIDGSVRPEHLDVPTIIKVANEFARRLA